MNRRIHMGNRGQAFDSSIYQELRDKACTIWISCLMKHPETPETVETLKQLKQCDKYWLLYLFAATISCLSRVSWTENISRLLKHPETPETVETLKH